MIEVSGIPKSHREDGREIIYKICELPSVDIKKSKIEIPHTFKNGDIIVKFKDKISHELVYNNQSKLKEKSNKDLGFIKESSIFINESLSFDNKKLLYDI